MLMSSETVFTAVQDIDSSRLVHGVMVGGRKSVGQVGKPAYIVLLGRRSRTFHLMEDDSISGVQCTTRGE